MPAAQHCPACARDVEEFLPGPNGRPFARCPHCNALERHRLIALLFDAWGGDFREARTLLEIAPQYQIRRLVRAMTMGVYLGLDIDPSAKPEVVGSITSLPFKTGSIDIVICMHVLEHIPDDGLAMSELARVLTSTGVAFIQVPRRPGVPTDEDPAAPESERIVRFGQADHVRYYGRDFERRLFTNGLQPTAVWPAMFLDPAQIERYGLKADEWLWVARTRHNNGDAFVGRADLERQLANTRRDLARLRNQPVVSFLRHARQLVRPRRRP